MTNVNAPAGRLCEGCGQPLRSGVAFCESCGRPVPAEAASAPAVAAVVPPPPPAPIAAPAPRAGSRSALVARIAWGLALLFTIGTRWFWGFAFLALLAAAILAVVPRVGGGTLRVIGWRHLPAVATLAGWRASLALLATAVAVFVVGTAITSR